MLYSADYDLKIACVHETVYKCHLSDRVYTEHCTINIKDIFSDLDPIFFFKSWIWIQLFSIRSWIRIQDFCCLNLDLDDTAYKCNFLIGCTMYIVQCTFRIFCGSGSEKNLIMLWKADFGSNWLYYYFPSYHGSGSRFFCYNLNLVEMLDPKIFSVKDF